MLDLSAPIIPGVSAAGFSLGMTRADAVRTMGSVAIKPPAEQMMWFLKHLPGWGKTDGGTSFFYKDVVHLSFSKVGVLYAIYLHEGYAGSLDGEVVIGSELEQWVEKYGLEFDEGDEAYYPTVQDQEGFALISIEPGRPEAGETYTVLGFSVHDWSLQDPR